MQGVIIEMGVFFWTQCTLLVKLSDAAYISAILCYFGPWKS